MNPQNMALAGKVALVTGGAQGIGRAVAEALLQNAAKISLVDFNQEVGEQCITCLDQEFGSDNCLFIQCDVTDREKLQDAFKRTVEHFGKLDIVINNAGINNEKNWEKTIEVNLEASEIENYGVRINVLCPAFVDTPLLQSIDQEEKMGKFYKHKDEIKHRMDIYGILKPSLIAEGMLKIINDNSLNGAVMKITTSKGIHFQSYEPMSA
ncbi:UNVERIFIED_CONTAM: hypothetical protein FKN15_048256 [Acipenser sinensis]